MSCGVQRSSTRRYLPFGSAKLSETMTEERRKERSQYVSPFTRRKSTRRRVTRRASDRRLSSDGVPLRSDGPPVILFPCLAGTVLECETSPVHPKGERIWINLKHLAGGKQDEIELGGIATNNMFVQHISLDPGTNGEDVMLKDGTSISTRPKMGLAGCEYLAEDSMISSIKEDSAILAHITGMLKTYNYTEWDENSKSGSMIGASYDWRIMPEHMERRDGMFTNYMNQVAQPHNPKTCTLTPFEL